VSIQRNYVTCVHKLLMFNWCTCLYLCHCMPDVRYHKCSLRTSLIWNQPKGTRVYQTWIYNTIRLVDVVVLAWHCCPATDVPFTTRYRLCIVSSLVVAGCTDDEETVIALRVPKYVYVMFRLKLIGHSFTNSHTKQQCVQNKSQIRTGPLVLTESQQI